MQPSPDNSNGQEFHSGNTTQNGEGIKSRGTRGIMEGIRSILGTEVVDVKPIEVPESAIVNARDKKNLEQKNGIVNSDDENNDDFFVEDEIIE